MAQWAPSEDDKQQHGLMATKSPAPETTLSSNNGLAQPHCIVGQGKITPDNNVRGTATGMGTSNCGEVGGKKGYRRAGGDYHWDGVKLGSVKIGINGHGIQKANPPVGLPNPTNNRDGIYPSDTSLQPNGAQLHPSESNMPPPLGGKLLVNWASNGSPTTPPSDSKSDQPGWVEKPGALMSEPSIERLQPPIQQATGCLVKGVETNKLRLQNKQRQHVLQEAAVPGVRPTSRYVSFGRKNSHQSYESP